MSSFPSFTHVSWKQIKKVKHSDRSDYVAYVMMYSRTSMKHIYFFSVICFNFIILIDFERYRSDACAKIFQSALSLLSSHEFYDDVCLKLNLYFSRRTSNKYNIYMYKSKQSYLKLSFVFFWVIHLKKCDMSFLRSKRNIHDLTSHEILDCHATVLS